MIWFYLVLYFCILVAAIQWWHAFCQSVATRDRFYDKGYTRGYDDGYTEGWNKSQNQVLNVISSARRTK